ncbi:MAG: type 4a pilus biogenesis protein PilO [Comamonas sp.]|nr:type 4a pilus biogenesis protein PilO [Comamonas sp.]
MKISKKMPSMDIAASLDHVKQQFQNLNPNDPSVWPVIPRILLCVAIAVLTAGAAWYFYLSNFESELEHERAQEVALRNEFQSKLLKSVSLEALKKQRAQVQQYVLQLERQLPSKAEMAALLSDINQAGLGRSLQFEMFKPSNIVVKDFYAELPITLRVSGGFHDMGAFAADVANLSRIVTLDDIVISPRGDDGSLVFDATARTYRYLDAEEITSKRKSVGK